MNSINHDLITLVYVSIGSNVEPEANVRMGLQALQQRFGELDCSPVYRTEAVGFDGDDFLNAVIGFATNLPVDELRSVLKAIEQECGRTRAAEKFTARTLDLDLLLYGDLIDAAKNIPRDEITRYAFVLKPLADIAGELEHPELRQSFQSLWDASGQRLAEPLESFVY